MKLPQKFLTQQKCSACRWQNNRFFCDMGEVAIHSFESLKVTHAYPKGTMLFIEGHPANGVYMLCSGRVKLSTYSKDGKAMILRVAEPGELLGLSATVANDNFEATAEVLDSCQVNFVRKADFLHFLNEHTPASLNALKQLSQNYHAAYSQVRSLGLSATVSDKLAGLMLDWCHRYGNGGDELTMRMPYTHEEIAEMIGSTRETVTRLLKNFRTRNLIILDRTELRIPNIQKLEQAIGLRVRL